MAIPALDNVVLDTIPEQIPVEEYSVQGVCDSCGMKAGYEATKKDLRLVFCGHHVRKNAASLIDRGFVIRPDTYQFA